MFVFSFLFFLMSQNETTSNWCSSRVQLKWGIFLESITFHYSVILVLTKSFLFFVFDFFFFFFPLTAGLHFVVVSLLFIVTLFDFLCFVFVLVFVCIYYNILHNVYSNEFHMWRRWSTVATLYAYFLDFFFIYFNYLVYVRWTSFCLVFLPFWIYFSFLSLSHSSPWLFVVVRLLKVKLTRCRLRKTKPVICCSFTFSFWSKNYIFLCVCLAKQIRWLCICDDVPLWN